MRFPKFDDLILFENDNVIVINKPPFVSTLDVREGNELNVLRWAKAYIGDAQVCHRLDKETSGALIIAKNAEMYRFISLQFEHREVRKIYHALVGGMQQFVGLRVDLPILNMGNKNVTIDRHRGKPALTLFNVIKYYKHYTLVDCCPVTGRMHQIRIHLAAQRAPIVGDFLYGGKPVFLSEIKRGYRLGKDREERPAMKRLALHAREIAFKIDVDTEVNIVAPYPNDFEVLLKLLDRYDV